MRVVSITHGALLCFLMSFLLYASSFCHCKDNSVEVVGIGECADCEEKDIKSIQAYSGLSVAIDCKTENGEFKTRGHGELDKEGKFKVYLPHDIVKDGKLKEDCYAQLHSASAAPCPAHDGLESNKIVFKTKTNDKHTFGLAGKLKFSPVTCASAFFWPYYQLPSLPKLPPWPPFPKHPHPKFYIPPVKDFGHPFPFPPKVFPPFPPHKVFPPIIYKPLPPFYKKPLPPPVPIYKKPLPPPVPIYKKPLPPPVPFYKKPLPPPVPFYKKPLPPPVPIYKKPLPPPVPIYKKPLPPPVPIYKKPLPPPVPIYKKPLPPPIPFFKKPLPPPIPFFKKPLPPPIPFFKKPLPPPIPFSRSHFHHLFQSIRLSLHSQRSLHFIRSHFHHLFQSIRLSLHSQRSLHFQRCLLIIRSLSPLFPSFPLSTRFLQSTSTTTNLESGLHCHHLLLFLRL
ncbi:LOW QUALITY PROTEIN: Pollen_Ole_e_I domain-containing protein, partial [Cephalotus follicularis]